ncbi:MAG: hypothetical protein JO171_19310 [Paludibacterium sp.]|uniref:hypothetical protein n=1 Tax=Paludibacterium sp. TaxID=1917523 RepID=UPI0025FC5A7A|nr:hypothetical protein [Paludibacterium sp.]MBV8049306.1 hypothetical protein [Paludibacterium sp.]
MYGTLFPFTAGIAYVHHPLRRIDIEILWARISQRPRRTIDDLWKTRISSPPPMITLADVSIGDSLNGDWQKIGDDLRTAVQHYGETAKKA